MTAELFLHGPRHAFYGKRDEVAYSQLFDNSQIKDNIQFIVEVRKSSDGKWYTYYNYCRYANVLDVSGRTGAYFGMTLRLDVYYANLRSVYTILDAIFVKGVLGLLLKSESANFQYLVGDFESSKSLILEKVEKPLGTLLGNIISMSEVYPIDTSFKIGGLVLRGLDDTIALERRLFDIKNNGKIVFSSSLPIESLQVVIDKCEKEKKLLVESRKQDIDRLSEKLLLSDKELNKKDYELKNSIEKINEFDLEIKSLKKQIVVFQEEQQQIKELKKEGDKLKESIQEFKGRIEKYQKEIYRLKQDNDKLLQKLQSQNKLQKKEKNRNNIEEAVVDVEKLKIEENVNDESASEEGRITKFRQLSRYLLPIITFFLGVLLALIVSHFLSDKKNNSMDESEIAEKEQSKSIIKENVDTINQSIRSEKIFLDEDTLFSGSEYTAYLTDTLDTCHWVVCNAEILEQSTTFVKFKPQKIGFYNIEVFCNNEIFARRIIIVK